MRIENRIAILCTEVNWMGPHAVARAAALAGAHVIALAPEQSLLAQSRYVADLRTYTPLYGDMDAFKAELRQMIGNGRPYLVIPGDSGAIEVLHALRDDRQTPPQIMRTVRRSVAPKSITDLCHDEMDFLRNFADLPCAPPPFLVEPDWEAVQAFAGRHGYPLVFKRSGLSGGQGVTLCRNLFEARRAFESCRFERFAVMKYIAGTPANVEMSGIAGRVSGAFAGIQRATRHENGPTSVRERIDHPAMLATATEIFRRTRFSGLAGVDFILDRNGTGWLLEFNQRITQPSAAGAIFGHDIVARLVADLRGEPYPGDPPRKSDLIAMFPAEVLRDPASPHLSTAYHNVPWDDPGVLKAIVNRMFP